MKPTITVNDFTQNFFKAIESLKVKKTLVGIPAPTTERKNDAGITNAAILFINEFGSPVNNIPARPVMAIGIRLAQNDIAAEYKKAAQAVLSKGFAALDLYYERAGSIASNSIKRVINDQTDIEGPSEATLKARKSRGFKGTKSLVVTGQLRNSITWVVRG